MASAQWGSRLGVIVAVIGSAVGLGNFLRFPGLLSEHGGGFIIPYAVAFLLLGLPLAWIEWSMGRAAGRLGVHALPGIARGLGGRRWLALPAAAGPAIPVLLFAFYIFVEAWCLWYAWLYLSGAAYTGAEAKPAFLALIGATAENGALFSAAGAPLLAVTAGCLLLNLGVLWLGVSRGIERLCLWAMPALLVIAVIVLVRVLTLEPVEGRTVVQGLAAMWEPRDLGATLADPKAWLDAVGQIFFTLSIGMGVIVTYASYVRQRDDVALAGLTAAAGNEFCEVVLGGMIVVPAAFIVLGAAYAQHTGSSITLGFFALPAVFEQMPGGRWFGFLFFFLLFLAAITSSISMLQPSLALFHEALGWGRRRAIALLGVVSGSGLACVLWGASGTAAIDTIELWAVTLMMPVFALGTILLFTVLWGLRRGLGELRRDAGMRLPPGLGVVMAVVAPLVLLVIIGSAVWQQAGLFAQGKGMIAGWTGSPAAQLATAWMLAVLILYIAIAARGQARWDRLLAGKDRP